MIIYHVNIKTWSKEDKCYYDENYKIKKWENILAYLNLSEMNQIIFITIEEV